MRQNTLNKYYRRENSNRGHQNADIMRQVLGRLETNMDVAAADLVCKAWRALKTPFPAESKYATIDWSTLCWIRTHRSRVKSFAFNLSSKKVGWKCMLQHACQR
jgi:hypothetical protein